MKLSDVKLADLNFELVSDSEFNQLGMATSKFDRYGVLSFFVDEKFFNSIINNENISCVITTKSNVLKFDSHKIGLLVCEDPKLFFYKLHNYLVTEQFYWKNFERKIDLTSLVAPTAIIPQQNLIIGKNSVIEDGVIIHEGVIIGDNVIIRSGSIIGSNGFQFLNESGFVFSVKTGGKLIIENGVEIQHNCCIDKGVLGGTTILKKDVKIDNFVHIAHDVIVGERTFITAGVKFGGRTVVGNDCWIGINATISNGLKIGNNCTISLGSVVTKDVDDGMTVSGNFAIDHKKFIEFIKTIR